MPKLSRTDLWSLEDYSEQRAAFRAQVMAHKQNRQLAMHPHLRLYFEDETTIKYQIQEMLRIERIFEAEAIREELDAYNPLIPDGHNLKATLMLEYPEVEQRQVATETLVGIEQKVYLQVEGFDKVYPIADEDLDRSDDTRTSTVHFLRFELAPMMIAALHKGASLLAGSDHPNLSIEASQVPEPVQQSLVKDLVPVSIN